MVCALYGLRFAFELPAMEISVLACDEV
jgi:hypothetical protein